MTTQPIQPVTGSDDACVISPMTRSESLTLTYRQRSGKRVIHVIHPDSMTHLRVDVFARARVQARKTITRNTRHMRHQTATTPRRTAAHR